MMFSLKRTMVRKNQARVALAEWLGSAEVAAVLVEKLLNTACMGNYQFEGRTLKGPFEFELHLDDVQSFLYGKPETIFEVEVEQPEEEAQRDTRPEPLTEPEVVPEPEVEPEVEAEPEAETETEEEERPRRRGRSRSRKAEEE